MFQKIAKHRANDASNDVHRPPLSPFPKDMINHIDEHNTGILDFPAFYNLVKKKSRDQVPINHHTPC